MTNPWKWSGSIPVRVVAKPEWLTSFLPAVDQWYPMRNSAANHDPRTITNNLVDLTKQIAAGMFQSDGLPWSVGPAIAVHPTMGAASGRTICMGYCGGTMDPQSGRFWFSGGGMAGAAAYCYNAFTQSWETWGTEEPVKRWWRRLGTYEGGSNWLGYPNNGTCLYSDRDLYVDPHSDPWLPVGFNLQAPGDNPPYSQLYSGALPDLNSTIQSGHTYQCLQWDGYRRELLRHGARQNDAQDGGSWWNFFRMRHKDSNWEITDYPTYNNNGCNPLDPMDWTMYSGQPEMPYWREVNRQTWDVYSMFENQIRKWSPVTQAFTTITTGSWTGGDFTSGLDHVHNRLLLIRPRTASSGGEFLSAMEAWEVNLAAIPSTPVASTITGALVGKISQYVNYDYNNESCAMTYVPQRDCYAFWNGDGVLYKITRTGTGAYIISEWATTQCNASAPYILNVGYSPLGGSGDGWRRPINQYIRGISPARTSDYYVNGATGGYATTWGRMWHWEVDGKGFVVLADNSDCPIWLMRTY